MAYIYQEMVKKYLLTAVHWLRYFRIVEHIHLNCYIMTYGRFQLGVVGKVDTVPVAQHRSSKMDLALKLYCS